MSLKLCLSIILSMIGCYIVDAQQVWTPDNGNGTFTNPIMWGDLCLRGYSTGGK